MVAPDNPRTGADTAGSDDVEVLATIATERFFSAGDVVCSPANRPLGRFFVVADGKAELIHETPHERVVLRLLQRGGLFGDLSGRGRIPVTFRTTARTDLRVLDISLHVMAALGGRYPQIWLRWAHLAVRQLERTHGSLMVLGTQTAAQRLARHLLAESEERNVHGFPARQGDLAAHLGVSRQTVSRVLGDLEAAGDLERHPGSFLVVHPERLRARLGDLPPEHGVKFEQSR